ncbi:MAG: cytochrome c biogenesis protein CcsA, partial [Pseudomonadota bacterium]
MSLLLPAWVFAGSDEFDYAKFAEIPILHAGRVKPLDSFARIHLKKFYGDKNIAGKPASAWLAGAVFSPQDAIDEPIFKINSPDIVQFLGLPGQKDSTYSFNVLAKPISAQDKLVRELAGLDKKDLGKNERELLRLYSNIGDFADIMGSFSLLMPLNDLDPSIYKRLHSMPGSSLAYIDILKIKADINDQLKLVVKKKADKIEQYSESERALAKLSYRLNLLEMTDKNSSLLRIIPPLWEGQEEWLSPWAVISRSQSSPQSVALFRQWQNLASSYQNGDANAWQKLSGELAAAGSSASSVRPFAIKIETLYNAVDPINHAMIIYFVGVLLAAVGFIPSLRICGTLAYLLVFANVGQHGLALLARMLILMRPPVSTLYESMIFVSFVVASVGLWIAAKKNNRETLLITSAIAGFLLISAATFAADSDTLEVLIAVLNTNFWLATHVVCITVGYAASVIAGGVAHLYLINSMFNKKSASIDFLQKNLHKIAVFALLFTAVGTMLGGIWADQS